MTIVKIYWNKMKKRLPKIMFHSFGIVGCLVCSLSVFRRMIFIFLQGYVILYEPKVIVLMAEIFITGWAFVYSIYLLLSLLKKLYKEVRKEWEK